VNFGIMVDRGSWWLQCWARRYVDECIV